MSEISPTFNSMLCFELLSQHIRLNEVCKRLMATLGKCIL